MKTVKAIVIVLSVFTLLSANIAFAEPTHNNEVGLYTNDDGTGATGTYVMEAPVDVYLVLTRPTDVVQALSLAGGFTPYAKTEEIQILRRTGKKQKVIKFDYSKIAEGQALETNILLQSGDTIVVP